MTALSDEILRARQANPGAYSNVSSNYLLGLVQNQTITPQTFADITNTNTVVLSNNNAQGGRSSLGIGQAIISAVQNNLPLNLTTLTSVPTASNPSGNPKIVNPDGTQTTATAPVLKQITDAFKSNAASVGVGAGTLLIVGLAAFLLLRRR